MTLLETIAEGLKAFLLSKVPIYSGYTTGERVEYIAEPDIVPEHVGTVIRTWNDRVKVLWDGFEHGHWLEEEAIRRCEL